MLTVQSFGWNSTGATRQKALLGSATARANLAAQIVAAVRDRGVDGVNLDIEPLPSGSEAGFTALVRLVRTKLDAVHRGYQLTFDTLGFVGNYPVEAATASGGADAIMIMGYDYRTASSTPVGSVAPLHKNGYDITDTVVAYTARVPASKLILGVPYYGRAWSTSANTLNATNISGTKYGASTTVTYDTARRLPRGERPPLRPARERRLDGVSPRELHGDVRLPEPLARALRRRCDGPRAQVRSRQQL